MLRISASSPSSATAIQYSKYTPQPKWPFRVHPIWWGEDWLLTCTACFYASDSLSRPQRLYTMLRISASSPSSATAIQYSKYTPQPKWPFRAHPIWWGEDWLLTCTACFYASDSLSRPQRLYTMLRISASSPISVSDIQYSKYTPQPLGPPGVYMNIYAWVTQTAYAAQLYASDSLSTS